MGKIFLTRRKSSYVSYNNFILILDSFFPKSFDEVNPEQRSKYSAWETPDPVYWTRRKYVVVRADERGLGQSPGFLDTMSRGTSECFFDVVEWAAEQSWSSGKVGLLGISYYAGRHITTYKWFRPLNFNRQPMACCSTETERLGCYHTMGGHVRLLS